MIASVPTSTGEPEVTEANLIADVIQNELRQVAVGHCVRVNHLTSTLAEEVASALARQPSPSNLTVRVLGTYSSRAITADQAIEIRNRKHGVFCLFVPAGAHDSTVSSLGNSFAELHGSSLIESAYKAFIDKPSISCKVKRSVRQIRSIFQTVGAAFRPTTTELLQFALAAHQRFETDESENFGLDLWTVGLIPDAGPDFENRLGRNRRAVAEISRPSRFTASLDDRIDKLRLTPDAQSQVKQILRNANLHDAKTWTKAVIDHAGGTFDLWTPIENPEPADCAKVSIIPFRDGQEMLSKKVRGLIQEGPGQPLFAPTGKKRVSRSGGKPSPRTRMCPSGFWKSFPQTNRQSGPTMRWSFHLRS